MNKLQLKPRDLKIISLIAATNSVSQTAVILGMAQANVSKYLFRLSPLREVWRFLIAHTLVSRLGVGRSLQAGLYARAPRSTRLLRPVPVTINLSPTRKDTQKRHWQQPLVTEQGGFRYEIS